MYDIHVEIIVGFSFISNIGENFILLKQVKLMTVQKYKLKIPGRGVYSRETLYVTAELHFKMGIF